MNLQCGSPLLPGVGEASFVGVGGGFGVTGGGFGVVGGGFGVGLLSQALGQELVPSGMVNAHVRSYFA